MLLYNYGEFSPNYNLLACQYFHFLNYDFGWNVIHAENGGEYFISELGYWVDYYLKNMNLIIEYDEPKHYDRDDNLKEKDIKRQQEIEDFLSPIQFIRLKEEHMKYEPSLLSQFACGII
jgi:hypothetical protein